MSRIDSEKFYKAALKQYGTTAYGLHWASDAHQSLRFEKILTLLGEDLQNNTLVDTGCGFGDFYSFLRRNSLHVKQYIGIDSLQEMCAIAKEQNSCKFLHADITKAQLPLADYYICSGALNILTPFETELFIRNCFSSCTKGFVFNALHGNKKSDTYNYITIQTIESLAKRLHVKRVEFEEGYIEHDITVGFFK